EVIGAENVALGVACDLTCTEDEFGRVLDDHRVRIMAERCVCVCRFDVRALDHGSPPRRCQSFCPRWCEGQGIMSGVSQWSTLLFVILVERLDMSRTKRRCGA